MFPSRLLLTKQNSHEGTRIMITRNLFQKIGMLTVIGLAAASCSQDELTGNRGLNGNAVRFGIVTPTSTPAEDTPETRALNADDTPVMLLAPEGKDTLYLHPWVTENHSVPSASQNKATTRGMPVENEENFANVCKSFGVTAYTQDGKLFMQDEKISKVSNGVWSPDETYFWPTGDTLDFYAYAPYEQTIDIDEKAIKFDHTVPDQATKQPDILFAYKECSKTQTTGGTVSLGFKHALAGVKFVAKNVTNCTVKNITLKNLYGQGSCTYDTESNTFTWTMSGETKDFSQTFDVTLSDQESGEQPITDVNRETTFMLIPQSLKDVTVEVQVETAEGTFTLTGSLAKTGEWKAGHIYTYAISTESINWEYVFEVTDNEVTDNEVTDNNITLALGETQTQYTVTSYRYRKGNPEAKEPVAWSAENTSFSETDQESGSRVETELKNILSDFTYQDENPSESKSYSLTVTNTTLKTTYDGDEKLKTNTPRGSANSPYDLSTHDENGGSIDKTTANCYVVNAAGTYQLPLVYGNAIKNGRENNAAYQGGNFKDYQNNTINNSRITNADNAVLVWSDGFFMFKDIHLDEAKENLVFTIDPDYMQQANAVLAVRDASNRIMWSWHIWVTERPVYTEWHTLQDLHNSSTYELMQCNLGWVDGKMVYYNQRNLTFQFTQAGSGRTATLNVTQEGAKFDYKDVGSTYYQWGRKDPLVALKNWNSYRYEDYRLHETGDPNYVYRYETGPTTIGNAIQHPNVFYTRGTSGGADWNNDHITTLWNTHENGGTIESTTSVKTIYDPSPRGFKVPMPRAFAIFVGGNTGDGSSSSQKGELNGYVYEEDDVHNKYRVYPQAYKKGKEIPLTATGQRADIAGLPVYEENGTTKAEVGGLWSLYGVYYWTCVRISDIAAYTLVIRKDHPSGVEVYSYGFAGTKTMARPVRPIKETN